MQAAFPTRDGRVLALFAALPGARGLVTAALEGMGRVWTDSPLHPRCAVAVAGDFLFCGGEPGLSAVRMLRTALQSEDRAWIIHADKGWDSVIARVMDTTTDTRWAFDCRIQPQDGQLRRMLEQAPAGIRFQPIVDEWIPWCRQQTWSEDFVSLYTDEAYVRKGLGVLVIVDGEAVAGASSYVSYTGGVEVQLQTREDMQGRGYATLAAAKMILMAHERGLVASWDAANAASAHIAVKLGYSPIGAYQVRMPKGQACCSAHPGADLY